MGLSIRLLENVTFLMYGLTYTYLMVTSHDTHTVSSGVLSHSDITLTSYSEISHL